MAIKSVIQFTSHFCRMFLTHYGFIKYRPKAVVQFTKVSSIQINTNCEISGSHGGDYEDGCLLSCCAV
jgi:hypothetical protein